MSANCGIYKVENLINGKCYFGQAGKLSYRAFGHLKWAVNGRETNRHLQNAVNRYGVENFKTTIVLYCEPFELKRYEQFFVDNFNSAYNICRECVTSPLGTKASDETRKKISNSMSGRSLSEEHKQHVREAHLGKVLSEETKKKISFTKKRRQKK